MNECQILSCVAYGYSNHFSFTYTHSHASLTDSHMRIHKRTNSMTHTQNLTQILSEITNRHTHTRRPKYILSDARAHTHPGTTSRSLTHTHKTGHIFSRFRRRHTYVQRQQQRCRRQRRRRRENPNTSAGREKKHSSIISLVSRGTKYFFESSGARPKILFVATKGHGQTTLVELRSPFHGSKPGQRLLHSGHGGAR